MSGANEMRNLDLGAAPLLDEGTRRERKKPEFFTCQVAEKQTTEIPEGKGEKLREIPNVMFRATKMALSDNLWSILHKLIYRGVGKQRTRKKNVMAFSGFAFLKEEEAARMEKVDKALHQLPIKDLNSLINLFDLPKGAKDKAERVESIAAFLKEPKIMSSVDISQAKKKPKKKSSSKRKVERGSSDQKPKKSRKVTVENKRGGNSKKVEVEETAPGESEGEAEEDHVDDPEEEAEKESEESGDGVSAGPAKEESDEDGEGPDLVADGKEPAPDDGSSEPASAVEDNAA